MQSVDDVLPITVIEDKIQMLLQRDVPQTMVALNEFKLEAEKLRLCIKVLGQLATSIGRAVQDLKKHLNLCRRAQEQAAKKEQADKDRREVERTKLSAMKRAEEVRQSQVSKTSQKACQSLHAVATCTSPFQEIADHGPPD